MRTGRVSYSIRAVLGGVLLVFSGVDLLVSQPALQGRVTYAENTFFVKFSQTARNQVVAAKTERVGRTGIASIDRLNKGAGVHRIAPVFRHAGRFEARHRSYGLDRWYRFDTDGRTQIADLLPQYRANPDVLAAEFQALPALPLEPEPSTIPYREATNNRLTSNDSLFSLQWHFDNEGQSGGNVDSDIDLPEAWEIETGDPAVTVAVLDTGVDPDHPDLAPNIWRNPGEIPDNGIDDDQNGYVDDAWGWDYFNDDNDPTYGAAHGTHVSGTVVAMTNNTHGVSGIAGGWGRENPGARVMVLKAHWGYPEAIVYAADNGATIASFSWSGSTFTYEIVEDAFRYFIDNASSLEGTMPGGLIIFAAGNDGSSQWIYPQAYSEIVSVAATDDEDKVPPWSNRGEWVDIAAPGVYVLSTYVHGAYKAMHGTSMAAPHVAGVAALVRSARPDLPAAAVRFILETSADRISQFNLRTGRLNALGALELAFGTLPDLYAEPSDLNFRTVTVGTARSMILTIWNITSQDQSVTVSTDNARFQANQERINIPASDSARIEVSFRPLQKPIETGILSISGAITTVQVPLRGDAHEFTDHYVGLQPVSFPSLEWADFDTDGDLDLLLTGESGSPAFKERHAIIYRNNGDQTFTNVDAGFNGVTNGQGSWVDYDNDGDFDVLLTGESTNEFDTRLFRNDGDGAFSLTEHSFPALVESSAAWADFDNDGDQDLALMGKDPPYVGEPVHYTLLYRNDAGHSFQQVGENLRGVSSGDLKWADFDNDGDFDLAVCGWDQTTRSTLLYRNTDGLLSETGTLFMPVSDCSLAWGDLDNDGDPDLLLTGESSWGPVTHVYQNDGDSGFAEGTGGLPPIRVGSSSLGDYDNDGYLDVLLTGFDGTKRISRVFRNEGALQFSSIGEDFVGLAVSSGAWADFDNDGDLDVIVAGMDPSQRYTRVYSNDGVQKPNALPTPPTSLKTEVVGGDAILSWAPGQDEETPSVSLTYGVRVGSISGEDDIVPAEALDDGRRLLTTRGNTLHRTDRTIGGFTNGTYYWSVQSVDHELSGSPFAPEGTFTVTDSPIDLPTLGRVTLRSPSDSALGEPTLVSLSWETLSEARYYQVHVSSDPGFGRLVEDEMTLLTAVDFVAPEAVCAYYWRVRGFLGAEVGDWSETRLFVTGQSGAFSPQLTFPEDNASGLTQPLTLTWSTAPEAVHYELEISSSPSFESPEFEIEDLTDVHFTVSNLTPGGRFHWRVRGVGPNGEGTWTRSRAFETLSLPWRVALSTPPDGAVDLDRGLTLTWSEADLADYYQVQIDSTTAFARPMVSDSALAEVELQLPDNLPGGRTYYWRVRAINKAGKGAWSDAWSFTVVAGTAAETGFSIPDDFRLLAVYPHPASTTLTLSFDLPERSTVTISLIDVQGRRVDYLVREDLPAARYVRRVRLPSVANGLYLIMMQAGGFSDADPILIIQP